MTNFPTIHDDQVALARAQKATGIILDEEFNIDISELKKVFTIFEGIQEAIDYIETIKSIRKDIEFIIYDKNQLVISFIQ